MKKTNKPTLTDDFAVQWEVKDMEPSSSGGFVATIDATHGGFVNRNFYYYVPSSMRNAAKSWITPFPKPMLINHDKGTDPLGRVKAARYIGDDSGGYIQLDVNIPDTDGAQKIQDGRYLTVSTSGTPIEFVKCSICGQDHLRAEEHCGHSRGQKYVDEDSGVTKTCFWYVGALEYKEVSFVNIPADQDAEHAATVTGWRFSDAEGDVPLNTDDTHIHRGVIMKDSLWIPETDEVLDALVARLNKGDIDFIANPSLWDTVESGDPLKRLQAYIKDGGKLQGDVPVIDIPLSDAETAALDRCESMTDKESRYLTSYMKDGKIKRHRHVIYQNEAGNGHSDYVFSHGHSVVDGKIQPAEIWNIDTEKVVSGHTHEVVGNTLEDTDRASTEISDKPFNPKHPFTVRTIADGKNVLHTLPEIKTDTSAIRDYTINRLAEMGYEDSAKLAEVYELLYLLKENV
ncbi:hypothetical protein [Acinetobacter sp.]|uniref:hypothetical protein n=1 Tax=Acinetobacter sp. TaxID=472 RepID=UPI003D06A9C7